MQHTGGRKRGSISRHWKMGRWLKSPKGSLGANVLLAEAWAMDVQTPAAATSEGTQNQPLQQPWEKSQHVLALVYSFPPHGHVQGKEFTPFLRYSRSLGAGKWPETCPKLSSLLLVLFVLLFQHLRGRSPGLRTREILCLGRQPLLPDQDQTVESQPASLEYSTVL